MRYLDSTLHVMDTTAMHTLAYSGKYVFSSGPKGRIGRVFHGKVEDLTKSKKQLIVKTGINRLTTNSLKN